MDYTIGYEIFFFLMSDGERFWELARMCNIFGSFSSGGCWILGNSTDLYSFPGYGGYTGGTPQPSQIGQQQQQYYQAAGYYQPPQQQQQVNKLLISDVRFGFG